MRVRWRSAGDSKWEAVAMLPPAGEEPTAWNLTETVVAVAVLTGRYGADDYPWDWYGERRFGSIGSGVSDTLRAAKSEVARRLP